MSTCYVCDDLVSEYGDPVCLGCYNIMRKRIEGLDKEVKDLKLERDTLLASFQRAQVKLNKLRELRVVREKL